MRKVMIGQVKLNNKTSALVDIRSRYLEIWRYFFHPEDGVGTPEYEDNGNEIGLKQSTTPPDQ